MWLVRKMEGKMVTEMEVGIHDLDDGDWLR